MKVFVLHDKSGRIRGVVTSHTHGVGIRPTKGMQVLTLEQDDLHDEDRQRFVVGLHQNYSVVQESGQHVLVEKPRKKG